MTPEAVPGLRPLVGVSGHLRRFLEAPVAAIVGAAVGALHGRAALPQRWIEGLLGRTRADDDGHAFALIDQAIARWVA